MTDDNNCWYLTGVNHFATKRWPNKSSGHAVYTNRLSASSLRCTISPVTDVIAKLWWNYPTRSYSFLRQERLVCVSAL